MKKTFLSLFTIMLLFGLASLGFSEMQVSLNNVNVDLPKIEVDIHLTGGEDVAGYSLLLAYDPAVLKYVDTIQGDYLPTGGIFLRPALGADNTYELQLTINDTTTIGQSVVFGEGEEAQTLVLSEFFFKVPDPTESGLLPGVSNDVGVIEPLPGTDTDVGVSDLKYQAVNVVSVAPLTANGNGTLASLSFDVLNPNMPMVIHLVEINLFDADDKELNAKLQNNVATFKKLASDVNADGVVNILDLTRVASVFGEPVSDDTAAADVNADGEINILDLVQVSQDFGQSVLSVVYTTELPVDTSAESENLPSPAADTVEPQPDPYQLSENFTTDNNGAITLIQGNAHLGAGATRGCLFLAGSINGVRYTVHEFKWQTRQNAEDNWTNIDSDRCDDRDTDIVPIHGYDLNAADPGQYRAVLDITTTHRMKLKTNTVIVE